MLLESVEKAEEDLAARRMIDLKTDGEIVIRATEKSLVHVGERLAREQVEEVRAGVDHLRQALAGSNPAEAQAALDRLNVLTLPIAEMQMNEVAAHLLHGRKLGDVGSIEDREPRG